MHSDPNSPNRRGQIFIVSAPSGAGKSTLCQAALKQCGKMRYSISHTTRKPRGKEKNGVDYYFVNEPFFQEGIEKDRWAEWARVHGNYYGTAIDTLEETLNAGYDLLLDIDVQGTEMILNTYPDAVTIFVMPPAFNVLKTRMESRGTDSPEVIARRIENARQEIAKKDRYRHIIINDDLEQAEQDLLQVIRQYGQNACLPPEADGSLPSGGSV